MLIEHYDLDIFTPPCDPGAERFSAKALLLTDISEALPYLNATLRGAVYTQAAAALTWKKGGHNIAFHAYEIATSNVEDRDAAVKELEGLVDLVNRTWERRAEITPDHDDAPASHWDGRIQAAAGHQLPAMRPALLLELRPQAGRGPGRAGCVSAAERTDLRRTADRVGGAARADAGHRAAGRGAGKRLTAPPGLLCLSL